jgi:hypothetical protein
MNGPSQDSFDYGDSNGKLENSAAGYFMGYSALPTSDKQLRSICAFEGRRLAKLVGGYVDGAADASSNSNSSSSSSSSSSGSDAVAPTKYNCGGKLAYSNSTPSGVIDCARLLMDFSAAGSEREIQALPTGKVFKLSAFGWEGRDALGFFRSAWSTESEGVSGKHSYLAFKAANGVPNHNDLDGGTFVFEAGGQRWGMDMSSDNYQLKEYFTQSLKYRYSYYRKSTAGHNTLTFNARPHRRENDGGDWGGSDQDPGMTGRTQITLFEGSDTDAGSGGNNQHHISGSGGPGSSGAAGAASSSPAYSIVDLTAAYGPQNSTRVERGFAFTASYEHLAIVDEFEFAPGASIHNVTWSMHTMAAITLGATGGAVLSRGGATLHATVVEPKGAVFSSVEVNLQPPYNPSVGVSKLMVVLPIAAAVANAGRSQFQEPVARIVVGLSLSPTEAAMTPNPLAQWKAKGPFVDG